MKINDDGDAAESLIRGTEQILSMHPLEDTQPRVGNGTGLSSAPKIEPAAAGLSSLTYTCVLLPRFPDHFLTGKLADKLGDWVPQLCLAFGWRLERFSIRPLYIQWTVQVAPSFSPGQLIRLLREETSKRIYDLKPEYQSDNPSADFWAPGYLMLSGFLPPTQPMLHDFIQQTRRRQGLER